jgi:thiol-disulfide isomerase/thioredoxin
MKKLSILLIMTLLMTGCTSSTKVNSRGFVAPCDQLKFIENPYPSDYTLPCLDGSGEINISQLALPLVINVWGSWCEGCQQQMPYFVKLYTTPLFKSGEIQMLGIIVKEKSLEAARNYIKKSGMSWPHLVDTSNDPWGLRFYQSDVPFTLFINAEGQRVAEKIGAYTNEQELFDEFEKVFDVTLLR